MAIDHKIQYDTIHLREAFQKKIIPNYGKNPKGGGVSSKNQKVQHSKFGLFDIFIFSPNVNVDYKCLRWTKNKLVLKWFLGNFKCFKGRVQKLN